MSDSFFSPAFLCLEQRQDSFLDLNLVSPAFLYLEPLVFQGLKTSGLHRFVDPGPTVPNMEMAESLNQFLERHFSCRGSKEGNYVSCDLWLRFDVSLFLLTNRAYILWRIQGLSSEIGTAHPRRHMSASLVAPSSEPMSDPPDRRCSSCGKWKQLSEFGGKQHYQSATH